MCPRSAGSMGRSACSCCSPTRSRARRSRSSSPAGTRVSWTRRSAPSDLAEPDQRQRRPRGPQHQGRRRRLRGRRPAGAGDPGRRGHEHHRHRRRGRPRRAGRQRAGTQRRRRRRADHGPAPGHRPADRRQRRRPARRALGQEGATQGGRAARQHARASSGSARSGCAWPSGRRRSGSRCRRWPSPAAASDVAARAEELGITIPRHARGAARDLRHRVAARAGPRRTRSISWTTSSWTGCGPARSWSTPRAATSSTRRRCCRRSTPAGSAPASTCTPTSRARGPPTGTRRSPSTPPSSAPTTSAPPRARPSSAIAAGVVEIVDAFATGRQPATASTSRRAVSAR